MTRRLQPNVLIIDDRPDEVRPRAIELRGTATVTIREPDDVTEADLGRSQLVMIDYRLEDWPGREALETVSLKPQNGVALAAVLRSHFTERPNKSQPAIALYSGRLDELTGARGAHSREHTIARLNNLEWAFAKAEVPAGVTLGQQISSLAGAVQRLPRAWPGVSNATSRLVRRLLALPDKPRWTERAWDDVEKCHPPYNELAEESRGLVFVRWLLHRILPYPCYLLDTRHLAARLRVTVSSLEEALSQDQRLRRRLMGITYSGILSDFLGPRWWRAGVDSLLWGMTRAQAFDTKALKAAITSKLSAALEPAELQEPVVALDEHLQPTDELAELEDCLEVQLDDWPSYAEPAWVRVADARESTVRGLVVSKDQERIGAPHEPDASE